MTRVGFVGLGNMGAPMARNLARAGSAVVAYDLSAEARERVRVPGVTLADSAADLAPAVEIFISMLPASAQVESLYLAPDSGGRCLLDHMAPGTLVVDCSTIAPATARAVGAAAAQRGLAMLDAPVSGGTGGAEKGTLTFIVGGEAQALERARPVLEKMGTSIFHAGAQGAGQVAKICNNLLLAIHMTGTAEALALGVANGLDPAVLTAIMGRSSGSNWSLNTYNPYPGVMEGVPAARGYAGGFVVDLMLKDLGLAMEAAQSAGACTPLGALARDLYRLLRTQHATGELDFSAVQKLYGTGDR